MYLLNIFSDVDNRFDISWTRFFNLLDFSSFENAWIFSFFLISYLINFLIMIVKRIFFFEFIFSVEHNDWLDVICFSFIIDRCRCVNLKLITQLHFSNVNIFFFQFMSELCNFNQDLFKMILWVIILIISKINAC